MPIKLEARLECRLHHICDYIISPSPLAGEPEYFDTTVMLARLWKGVADQDATALTSALQKGQRSGRHLPYAQGPITLGSKVRLFAKE
jgi:hypothetical protein